MTRMIHVLDGNNLFRAESHSVASSFNFRKREGSAALEVGSLPVTAVLGFETQPGGGSARKNTFSLDNW